MKSDVQQAQGCLELGLVDFVFSQSFLIVFNLLFSQDTAMWAAILSVLTGRICLEIIKV